MNNNESEFQKASALLKGVRLSESEKSTMLQNIYREAKMPTGVTPTPFTFSSFFQNHRYVSTFAAVVLLIGGTAHASFESLPGDPLYGIKVNVIEPVALTLMLDEEAKNEYRVSVLQERVEEIQKLKAEGRLDFEIETISSVAARENLTEIESSAMFTATGTNLEVSGHVETYNSLVEETHRLKTIIGVEPKDEEEKEDKDETKDEQKSETPTKTAGEVEETVTRTLNATTEAVDEVTEEVEDVLDPIVPPLKNIGI